MQIAEDTQLIVFIFVCNGYLKQELKKYNNLIYLAINEKSVSPIIQLGDHSEFRDCILGYGHFNSIHPGHLRYLKHAKDINNLFVVAIMKNLSSNGIVFSQNERALSVAQLGIADAVILLPNNSLNEAVLNLSPKKSFLVGI